MAETAEAPPGTLAAMALHSFSVEESIHIGPLATENTEANKTPSNTEINR